MAGSASDSSTADPAGNRYSSSAAPVARLSACAPRNPLSSTIPRTCIEAAPMCPPRLFITDVRYFFASSGAVSAVATRQPANPRETETSEVRLLFNIIELRQQLCCKNNKEVKPPLSGDLRLHFRGIHR